jgi:hypothetical protein
MRIAKIVINLCNHKVNLITFAVYLRKFCTMSYMFQGITTPFWNSGVYTYEPNSPVCWGYNTVYNGIHWYL